MGSVDGNVEELTLAIMSEARVEAEHVKMQAESAADAIRKRAQAEADRERGSILARAAQEAERLRAQALASARLKARAAELQAREQLLESVFTEVARQLPSVRERQDYAEIARKLTREALVQLHSGTAEILGDNQARRALTPAVLDQIGSELHVKVTLGNDLDRGSGVIARTADGHLHFDNTLENRLARLRTTLRADVYRILTGEAK